MTAALSRASLAKELRALLVPWLLVMAAVALAGVTDDSFALPVAMVGAVGLGAWSVGHEYSYRTLPLLLAQPRDRRSLWLDKIAVLAALLTALFLLGAAFFPIVDVPGAIFAGALVAVGLTVVTWLTLIARSARGGVIFTIAVLLMGYIAVTWAGETIAVRYPDAWPDPKLFARRAVALSLFGLVAATAALGWRTFRGLSAIDEGTEHLTLPEFRRADERAASMAPSRRRPIVALFGKELGLQVPVFVVSSVYVLAWFGGWMLRPSTRESLVLATTYLHGFIVPLLAGSLASAEERRMGILATQLLQPVSARVQWVIKAAVVVGLAVVLAVGLPALLQLTDPSVLISRGLRQTALGSDFLRIRTITSMIAAVALAAALSLYVSSLVRNSLHALLASIVAGVAFAFVLGQAMFWVTFSQSQFVQSLVKMRATLPRDGAVLMRWQLHVNAVRSAYQDVVLAMTVLVVVGGILLFVRHGSENHRFADHRPARLAMQIGSILLLPVIALLGFYALPVWFLGR